MKRPFRDIDPTLTDAEIARISEILETLPIANKNLSWLEALAPISNGKLLAKILYKLQESDLKLVCRVSKLVNEVCKRYQLHERFYTGKVYMFGNGIHGALGNGNATPHVGGIPQKIENIPLVKLVSCNDLYTGVITVSGEVYMFGRSTHGNLGDGIDAFHTVAIPQKIANIPPVKVISCGLYYTGLVTVSGEVYMFGDGTDGKLGDRDAEIHAISIPRKIQNIPPVKTISCGNFHTGIVTIDGGVYTFGLGNLGRLGDGDVSDHTVPIPKKIENIPPVKSISCGLSHTGIVTNAGEVYMFGFGWFGRLGDGDISEHAISIPRKIQNIPASEAISCGVWHTGIVTLFGDVYMFGDGNFGKLGDGDLSPHEASIPKKIQNIPPIKAISCSQYSTALVTLNGDVYTFGNSRHGRLGDGNVLPHSVGIPQKLQNTPPVQSISCGSEHTGFVTIPESSLDLTIDCQYCGVNQAVYHDHTAVFCSQQCQRRYYFN